MRMGALPVPGDSSDPRSIADQQRALKLQEAFSDGTAGEFDGWIASGMYRSPAECVDALTGYRVSGGGRAIVSTIQVAQKHSAGRPGHWNPARAGFISVVSS